MLLNNNNYIYVYMFKIIFLKLYLEFNKKNLNNFNNFLIKKYNYFISIIFKY